jgi:putative transposase
LRRPVESEQYTSIDYTQTLADHGVLASVGSVGDAYDNALAESFVDSFKTELIADRVWQTRSQLELAVVEYIGWFNHDRLHEALGDIPPAEWEALYAPWNETTISLEMKRGSPLTRSP